jgi:hypothetical protein
MSGDSGAGSPTEVGFWEVLAFGCELAMLAALALAGWMLAPTVPTAVTMAFALPALTGLIWGLWLAPRARRRLPDPARTGAKILVFLSTGSALAIANHLGWGTMLAAVGVIDAVMLSRRETLRTRP